MKRQLVILVTGASSGIGKSVALALIEDGHRVFGTSRNIATGSKIDMVEFVKMDVTSEHEVLKGIEHVVESSGRIDAVVNNAGLGMVGPVECTTDDEARDIFNTNLFGVLNVCRHVIPVMRSQGFGYVINVTSLAGQMGLPFRGIYSASKFAVEGFTESLSQEVMQFGIRVVMIEPGDFRTGINENRKVAANIHQAYGSQSADVLQQICAEVSKAPTPEAIGKRIVSILADERPFLRYRVANLMQRFSLTLMRTLPGRWFEFLVMKHYRMRR
jgi:NAD(P)-dependent dehydrogenase (short-subunit alcohol dehydrogenase family)